MRATGLKCKINASGNIKIPKEVCKELGIKKDQGFEIFTESDSIILQKEIVESPAIDALEALRNIITDMEYTQIRTISKHIDEIRKIIEEEDE